MGQQRCEERVGLLPRRFKDVIAIGVLTAVYFCAGRLGLSAALVHVSASAIWPPTGLALAAMLLLGYRMWPAIFVGAFLVNWEKQPALPSLGIALGNTLEAVAGTMLARAFAGGELTFWEPASIFRFLLFAALPSTALSASIGVATLALNNHLSPGSGFEVWLTWWTGDFISDLLVAPLILLWWTGPPTQVRWLRCTECMVMLAAVFAFGRFTFSGGWVRGGREYPLEYLGIPLLLWAAFRFGQRGAITAAVMMSAVAAWGTLRGHGPFAVTDRNDSLLLLQSFIGVTTLTMLVLAAVVADWKASQKRERDARTEAERANSAKDQFLAVLSHELRTPLTPVMLAASILENDRELPERVREDLQTIRRNVELEARLIDDLLDLTRITRGKLQLDLHVVDIHELIRSAIDICCRDSRVKMEVKLEAAEHFVHADPARIQQVFWNLLNNAQKFTPQGGTISIHSSDSGPDIVIAVSDTGAGIEAELMPRLFDAFAQGAPAASPLGAGGLGLGLAISRALVRGHRGSIEARSAGRGKGATFIVRLPTTPRPQQAGSVLPEGQNEVQSPAGLKILLIEDHPSTLALLSKLLEAMGHHVTPAGSVASGLAALEREPFDLLISDLGLPDGVGYDLMQQAKTKYSIRGIALSGYGMDSDVKRSLEAGFSEHLTKPINMETLAAAIARTAGARKVTAAERS